MQYEIMCQWRDIAEFLVQQPWKFVENNETPRQFSVLLESQRPHRAELWSLYMLQICQYSRDPYSFYHKVKRRNLTWGWRLLPDWEAKIDFLEQITLFNRNPDDVPQPWRAKIWQATIERREREFNRAVLLEQIIDAAKAKRIECKRRIENDECSAGFTCKLMSGESLASLCANKRECDRFMASL